MRIAPLKKAWLKQGFVNVMATRAFQDSTTRGFDSRLASFQRVSLLRDSSSAATFRKESGNTAGDASLRGVGDGWDQFGD